MFRHSTRRLQLGTALLLALIIAGCSSSDEGGGAPAAVADTGSGGDEATGEFVLKQTFDMGIEVTSPVFNWIRRIPKSYVCKGQPPKPGQSFEQNAATKYANRENISPPLEWTGIPDGTQSIALLMDSDQIVHEQAPDARWAHWLIWNLPPDTTGLPERVATTTELADFGPDTRQGTNDDKVIGYSGPCPLPVTIRHQGQSGGPTQKLVLEYLFRVYALDTLLGIPGGATRDEFLQAIDGHILSGGVIRGEFVASKQLLEH